MSRTIIVGGGLAGLAAAVALAERGLPVTLLESRPRLGGRASSFVDHRTGETIDNCQHVAMGCCTNFLHFCRSVGADGLLREERELFFIGRDNCVHRFAESRLPAPLHLWPAFRRLSGLSRVDLRGIGRGLRELARTSPAALRGRAFSDWLDEQRQTPAAAESFWRVVLVSALSETLDRIDASHARKVFVDGFLASRQGWRVHIPRAPLEELYGDRLQHRLSGLGATVRLQTGAERLEIEGDRAASVELRGGERVAGEQFILAVPHHLVLPLLPETLRTGPQLARVAALESAPISSVHLWFDRPITDLPHAVFVERLSQWMFNRNAVWSGATDGTASDSSHSQLSTLNSQLSYYQIVISASRELGGRTQDEIVAHVVRELSEVWPQAAAAGLVRSRVVTEHRAVFSPTPGCDELRPPQQSPIANVQLAGDWTQTGWPATMEGAVRSGYLAAENVLAHFGRRERLVQPDLPTAWLARLLLGLQTEPGNHHTKVPNHGAGSHSCRMRTPPSWPS
ncbi:MAG TPA: hydroxysqualene dehydroxylase HpnE [Planctomycetaceae bacterium]|nr:hydroxysqualene dehydroxylase HpnE [Planctomycetaceae bacterium]